MNDKTEGSVDLMDLAQRVVAFAQKLGADEATASVAQSSQATLQRRGGVVEQATEAMTRGMSISMLVNDRFTSNSTSDLRPEALEPFLRKCIDAAQYLEPDEAYRLPDGSLCGRGIDEDKLDLNDPAWHAYTSADREELAREMEDRLLEHSADDMVSAAAYVGDGRSSSVRVSSNGFADQSSSGWFVSGGEMTLKEGDKRPESAAYYGSVYRSDLPAPADIAQEVAERVRRRLGSGPIDSGNYPMILSNRAVGRLLGTLGGPMSGGSLFEGRSCLADKLGTKIGSDLFTLIDDPFIPRGLGSTAWDGDAFPAKQRTLIENGVLKQYNISHYYSKKLKMAHTSGGKSNWVVPHGDKTWQELVKEHPKAVLVTGFLGGNANGTSGDFSYGIRGMLVEHGEITKPLSEMNVSGNTLELFHQLIALANDPWKWSSVRAPTMIFDDVPFSGS